jgi:hypothetical protein
MEVKQTGVEWLYDQIENEGKCIYEVIEQAKKMDDEFLEKLKDFDNWKEWKNSVYL